MMYLLCIFIFGCTKDHCFLLPPSQFFEWSYEEEGVVCAWKVCRIVVMIGSISAHLESGYHRCCA